MFQQFFTRLGQGGDFGEPNRRFDSLDLAEEWAHAMKVVMPPMLEQACCLGGDLPLADR
ncbi:hypothetical protein D9M69_650020 [compost metagenome]